MKIIIMILMTFFLSAHSVEAKDKTNILIKHNLVVNGTKHKIVIESIPSKPESNGKGYCGAGEEIKLHIFSSGSKNKSYSKLIESCLENLILKDSTAYGGQNSKSLLLGVNLDHNPIVIFWDSKEGKLNTSGQIDLSSGVPEYKEITEIKK